jgi:hypothetical protein
LARDRLLSFIAASDHAIDARRSPNLLLDLCLSTLSFALLSLSFPKTIKQCRKSFYDHPSVHLRLDDYSSLTPRKGKELQRGVSLLTRSFSLGGTLTTYDSYPERCLPDRWVSASSRSVVSSSLTPVRLNCPMVVRYPYRVAKCNIPEPGPPHAEDGALAQTYCMQLGIWTRGGASDGGGEGEGDRRRSRALADGSWTVLRSSRLAARIFNMSTPQSILTS